MLGKIIRGQIARKTSLWHVPNWSSRSIIRWGMAVLWTLLLLWAYYYLHTH